MITKENFKALIMTLEAETIQSVLNAPNDYVLMEAHIFNAGGFATLESVDYDEEAEEEANANGNLFTDKDTFMILLEETEALEY